MRKTIHFGRAPSFAPLFLLVLGNGWEWGNGTIIHNYYGLLWMFMDHSLIPYVNSTSQGGSQKMDPAPGDVVLWRSREDEEPLQRWAPRWRARLPRHRGDRASSVTHGGKAGVERWLWTKTWNGWSDLYDFIQKNQRTIFFSVCP